MSTDYLDFIKGDNVKALYVQEENVTLEQTKSFKYWNHGARQVMCWLSTSIHDTLIGHIQDAKYPTEAQKGLVTLYETNTNEDEGIVESLENRQANGSILGEDFLFR